MVAVPMPLARGDPPWPPMRPGTCVAPSCAMAAPACAFAAAIHEFLEESSSIPGPLYEPQVRIGGKVSTVPLRAGDAVGFPAKRLQHRVTKCTAGLRQSLVFWVTRPGAR